MPVASERLTLSPVGAHCVRCSVVIGTAKRKGYVMERITVVDVRRAFAAHVETLDALGIAHERLVLTEGEGELVAYRINTRRDGGGLDHPPVGDDFLGNTARDAYRTLTERTRAIFDTARALKESAGAR